jgi:hypothetical protein
MHSPPMGIARLEPSALAQLPTPAIAMRMLLLFAMMCPCLSMTCLEDLSMTCLEEMRWHIFGMRAVGSSINPQRLEYAWKTNRLRNATIV